MKENLEHGMSAGVTASSGQLEDATVRAASPRQPAARIPTWLLGFLLFAAVFLAYQPVWHAGFIWDDDVYVTDNELLVAPDGLRRIWFSLDSPSQYFPLTYTTFRIERAFWGLNPAGYHGINLFLHVLNALLLWRLLKRLNTPGAWLAAAIFALHPVHVESVAWITERKNVLSLFFSLLSLLAWLRFTEARRPRPWYFYAASIACYSLALSSKTTACTLPAALLLILWWKQERLGWPRLAQIIPFLVLGAGMGLLTVWWERYHQQTQGELFAFGFRDRLLIASRALWFYGGKLFWPTHLAFSYPRWKIDGANPLAYGWLAACAISVPTVLQARRFLGRGLEVAVLFFAATLAPVLGFIMLYTFAYTFVADHYQYVASIGPIALAAGGLALVFKKPICSRIAFLRIPLCAALLLMLGALTWRRSSLYADSDTLWRATLTENPDSVLALVNLGSELMRRDVDEATALFKRALQVQPDDAVACYNLGNALLQKGQADEALVFFKRAVKSAPSDPVAQYNLGVALFQQGRTDEAIEYFQKAVFIRPKYVAAHFNLGIALFQTGRGTEAVLHFQDALKTQPDFVDAHYNLAIALSAQGRLREAETAFRDVLKFQPDHLDALDHLAWMLATCPDTSIRNGASAVELAAHAAQLTGGSEPAVLDTLAAAQAEAGLFSEAVATSEKAFALASARSQTDLAGEIHARTGIYRAHFPFRQGNSANLPAGSQ
jgi:tetratricopeptide (TPR) repeat protein